MEWEQSRESTNVEDRRGGDSSGGFGIPVAGGTGGLGIGAILILAAIGYFTGIDPRVLIGGAQIVMGNGGAGSYTTPSPAPSQANIQSRTVPANDPTGVFVKKILGETED